MGNSFFGCPRLLDNRAAALQGRLGLVVAALRAVEEVARGPNIASPAQKTPRWLADCHQLDVLREEPCGSSHPRGAKRRCIRRDAPVGACSAHNKNNGRPDEPPPRSPPTF